MEDVLNLLTLDWFWKRAVVGVAIGYSLRMFEHFVWSVRAPKDHNPHGNWGFALMNLPQSVLFGFALGYVFVAIIAYNIPSQNVVGISTYALTGFMAFIANDFRELLRRISRW